jgi:hypothetical protein
MEKQLLPKSAINRAPFCHNWREISPVILIQGPYTGDPARMQPPGFTSSKSVPNWCQTRKQNTSLSRITRLSDHLENGDFAETFAS